MKGPMTVGEIRRLIAGVPDDAGVFLSNVYGWATGGYVEHTTNADRPNDRIVFLSVVAGPVEGCAEPRLTVAV